MFRRLDRERHLPTKEAREDEGGREGRPDRKRHVHRWDVESLHNVGQVDQSGLTSGFPLTVGSGVLDETLRHGFVLRRGTSRPKSK